MPPVLIDNVPRPQDGRNNLLKYVKFTGTKAGACTYIEMQTCLLLEYLKKREPNCDVQRVLDEMVLVNFEESSSQNILDVFQHGIYVRNKMDQRYNFLGHSREQLKRKTCLLIRKSPEKIYDILADFADFQQVEPIDKRADQIGVLFTCFTHSKELEEDEFDVIIDDGQKPQGESRKMSEAIRKLFYPDPVPSVMHARCDDNQGIMLRTKKEVLLTRSTEAVKVKELPRMLGIIDYSKPYSMGYLDTLSVMMLNKKGVNPIIMERLQAEYHDHLETITKDVDLAKWFLTRIGKIDLSTDLCNVEAASQGARNNIEEIQQEVRKIKEEGVFNDSDGKGRQKRLVLKSRKVFGAYDPYSQLRTNECFFNPTLPSEEREDFKLAENLLIMHLPCYNPDHICILKLVHKSDVRAANYEDIQDCLILGRDDVQGDSRKYFVSWDKDLIPPNALTSESISSRVKSYLPSPPALPSFQGDLRPNLCHLTGAFLSCFGLCGSSLSSADETQRKTKQRSLLLELFASFNDLFSKADELFMERAFKDGSPSSDRCRRLSDILCGKIDPCTQMEEAERIIKEEDQEESDTGEHDDEGTPLID